MLSRVSGIVWNKCGTIAGADADGRESTLVSGELLNEDPTHEKDDCHVVGSSEVDEAATCLPVVLVIDSCEVPSMLRPLLLGIDWL